MPKVKHVRDMTKLLPLPDDDNTLLLRRELPQYLPIATQTFNRWACEGKGPRMTRIGRRVVTYRVGDIKTWLKNCNPRDNEWEMMLKETGVLGELK